MSDEHSGSVNVIEDIKHGWNNGERSLIKAFIAFTLSMVVVIVLLVVRLGVVVSDTGDDVEPLYYVKSPVVIQASDQVSGVPRVTSNKVAIKKYFCNTSSAPLILLQNVYLTPIDSKGDLTGIFRAAPQRVVIAPPGGALCNNDESMPVTEHVDLEPEITNGRWMLTTYVDVLQCLEWSSVSTLRSGADITCDSTGRLAQNGVWYSEQFVVDR